MGISYDNVNIGSSHSNSSSNTNRATVCTSYCNFVMDVERKFSVGVIYNS